MTLNLIWSCDPFGSMRVMYLPPGAPAWAVIAYITGFDCLYLPSPSPPRAPRARLSDLHAGTLGPAARPNLRPVEHPSPLAKRDLPARIFGDSRVERRPGYTDAGALGEDQVHLVPVPNLYAIVEALVLVEDRRHENGLRTRMGLRS